MEEMESRCGMARGMERLKVKCKGKRPHFFGMIWQDLVAQLAAARPLLPQVLPGVPGVPGSPGGRQHQTGITYVA